MPPLLMFSVIFLVFSLPPYLGFDPSKSRLPTHPDHPVYYPLGWSGHILFGSGGAADRGCLQVWPWLRAPVPGGAPLDRGGCTCSAGCSRVA